MQSNQEYIKASLVLVTNWTFKMVKSKKKKRGGEKKPQTPSAE